MANKKDLTPMQAQYDQIKREYQDCLLFYRMGDFYEMFGEDALVGSRALGITLTSRNKDEHAMPMCGVPFKAAEVYIAKLIEQGFKVAICEQMENPKLAKGLVRREVIRVITPGTLVDDNLLTEDGANYLAAVFPLGEGYGLAYADISTGEFAAAQVEGEQALLRLGDELAAIDPRECLVPKSLLEEPFFANHAWRLDSPVTITPAVEELFVRQNGEALLLTHFQLPSLEALGLAGLDGAALAAAELLYFCQLTQKRELSYMNRLRVYSIDNYLTLDANTRRNLELVASMRQGKKAGSLYGVCDRCRTALGSRLLKSWLEKPELSSATVNLRLAGIEELLGAPEALYGFREALRGVADLERLIGRVAYGNASPRDILALKHSFGGLPELERGLLPLQAEIFHQLYGRFDTLGDLYQAIDERLYDPPARALDKVDKEDVAAVTKALARKEKLPDWTIKPGFSREVDELRQIRDEGADYILALEAREREKTGIKTLRVCYNKVFGYFIEVRKSAAEAVPEEYIRRQTLVNCERFVTQELAALEEKLSHAGERLQGLEAELLGALKQEIVNQTARIQNTAKCVALLDALCSLAALAEDMGYVRPVVDDSDCLIIQAGRHPVVEQAIGRENYIPNDTYMKGEEKRFGLITGPNMAGKSTYMRQVALIVILARIGSFVPAAAAHIGRIDRIFTRVGASDDLSAGQSTFMVEMSETSNILRSATPASLVILDEIGRGTSTYDGLSIAWAVSEYLLRPECCPKTLFATHYHELNALAEHWPQVQNYAVAVRDKGDSIVFLRKIVEGGADKSYGVHVAKLAGLPEQVIKRAKGILRQLEAKGELAVPVDMPIDMSVEEAGESLRGNEQEVLKELAGIDTNNLRPVEALLYIEKWKKLLAAERR